MGYNSSGHITVVSMSALSTGHMSYDHTADDNTLRNISSLAHSKRTNLQKSILQEKEKNYAISTNLDFFYHSFQYEQPEKDYNQYVGLWIKS